MAELERVIEGLEQHMKMSCLSRIEGLQPIFCPYFRDGDCIINMCRDALELLKEQEPIEPIHNLGITRCGNCNCEIDKYEGIKYCPFCGRKVKWN
jgi:hypothetical protein